jgi:hypothetical protein
MATDGEGEYPEDNSLGACADRESLPGGCPPGFGLTPTPGGPQGTPTPPAVVSCPAPTITYADIPASGEIAAPLHPVVRQDPQKRGADLSLEVTIPPVIFTWYEASITRVCKPAPGGNGGGCPGPGSRYDRVTGGDGSHSGWDVSLENNPGWQANVETECVELVEVLPDYLDDVTLGIHLSSASRTWILSDLAQAYPGAHLKRPDWLFAIQGSGSLSDGSAVSWSQLVPEIQVADPGLYQIQVSGRTVGTLVSAPRAFDLPLGDFMVDLLRGLIAYARQPKKPSLGREVLACLPA